MKRFTYSYDTLINRGLSDVLSKQKLVLMLLRGYYFWDDNQKILTIWLEKNSDLEYEW